MQTLDEAGEGRVLVVDGQASKRCALLGDILGAKLHRNGFSVRVPSRPLKTCSAQHADPCPFPLFLTYSLAKICILMAVSNLLLAAPKAVRLDAWQSLLARCLQTHLTSVRNR
jgi:hypothetical protein